MQDDIEISVEQLEQQLKRKGIPLPFEIGAFIALEVCEQVVRAPTYVRAADVWIGEIGEIMVESGAARAPEDQAVRATLALLGDLLVCSAPGVPPMLLELIEHGPSAKEWTLSRLRDDLEACLLPLNRGATRRVLARLLREVHREGDRALLRPSGAPDAEALDAELDNLLGLEPGELPPPPKPLVEPMATEPAADHEAGQETAGQAAQARPQASSGSPALPTLPASPAQLGSLARSAAVESPQAAGGGQPALQPSAAPQVTQQQERGPRLRTEELFEEPASSGTSGGMVIGGLFFLIAVVLAVAYMTLGQLGARKLFGLPTHERAAAPPPAPAPTKAISGELRVTSTPAHAQVFLYVGQGPALATDLPIGVAQEFVALVDGHAPARAVVPADASWEKGSGQPRYELAMQVGASVEASRARELGRTRLTRDTGSPTGSLGTVRIITTPPGAKVYQLIGFTPDVAVSGLRLDRTYTLMVYAPGFALEARTLRAADFVGEGAERSASVEVTLTKRNKR